MRLTIPRLIRLLPLLIGAAQPLHAEDGGDPRLEEDACQADIHRLCDRFFPDAKLVATCLVDKRTDLSPACAALLANPPPVDAEGAAPPAVPPGSSETQGRWRVDTDARLCRRWVVSPGRAKREPGTYDNALAG